MAEDKTLERYLEIVKSASVVLKYDRESKELTASTEIFPGLTGVGTGNNIPEALSALSDGLTDLKHECVQFAALPGLEIPIGDEQILKK